MPPAGFEHATPGNEQPQTYAVAREATGIKPVTTIVIKSGMVS